jgi:hypothetical protein
MTITHKELDLGMSLFLELIQGEEGLRGAFNTARGEYFPSGGAFAGDPSDAPAAEMRYLEWFLFEHEVSEKLVIEHLLPAWREMASPEICELEPVFASTMASMFVLGDAAGNDLHWIRDIAGLGEYAVDLRSPTGSLQAGDLIVGRLYSNGDSTHTLSPSAGCFRDEDLLSAVSADVDSARSSGQRNALRMRQVDLEAMFWGRSKIEESANPQQKLRAFLNDGGLSAEEIDGLIESLANQPLPEDSSSPLVAGYLGELLNHLAFETDIDLTRAQELFLACWAHLQNPNLNTSNESETPSSPSSNDLEADATESAVEEFTQSRGSGLDAAAAISQLCERLGIDVEDEEPEEDSEESFSFAVLPALFTEYLWDITRTQGEEEAVRDSCLKAPLATIEDIQIVEELTAKRLLLFGCTYLPQANEINTEQAAQIACSLQRFTQWCAEHHDVPIDEEVIAALESLPDSVRRVLQVNEKLDSETASGDWYPAESSPNGLIVRDKTDEDTEVSIELLASYGLEEGDFVRGALHESTLVVTRCYPRELSASK